jgi:hypothetical protein
MSQNNMNTNQTCRFKDCACKSSSRHAPRHIVFTPKRIDRRVDSVVNEGWQLSSALVWPKEGQQRNNLPSTPAELPMNVPLLVTEFRTLLIRNLKFDAASGLRAPSRTPHKPPRAKPYKKEKGRKKE